MSSSATANVNGSEYINLLVAEYLKQNNYNDTLKNFLNEGNISANLVKAFTNDRKDEDNTENLQNIIHDRLQYNEYQITSKLNSFKLNDTLPDFSDLAKPFIPSWDHSGLDFIHHAIESPPRGMVIYSNYSTESGQLMLSTSNKEVHIYDKMLGYEGKLVSAEKQIGLVRLCGTFNDDMYYYTCGIDGSLSLYDDSKSMVKECNWKIHDRMITHINIMPTDDSKNLWYIITCGLDNFLKIHKLAIINNGISVELLSKSKLLSPVTSFLVTSLKCNDNSKNTKPMIFISRSDHTRIMCFTLIYNQISLAYEIALNNAQFTTHSFNVRDMEVINTLKLDNKVNQLTENSMIAVVTSHTPYMRLILINIPNHIDEDVESIMTNFKNSIQITNPTTVYYDMIIWNMATEVPQDSYSQPILKTLPENRGLIVGSDVGIHAIDILKGESWFIEVDGNDKNIRIKTLEISEKNNQIVAGLVNKSTHIYNIK